MSNGNGHHWSKFFWRDWSADKALHPCSLAAKGFWIEMLCIMHEGCPVGHLTLGGKPATLRQMAANACCTEKEAAKYVAELEDAGVLSRTENGTIYCRRMVKDAAASEAGREHIKKRWNGHPPNRGPNRGPIRDPKPEPITKKLEAELEAERPPRSPPVTGGVARRAQKPLYRNGFRQLEHEERERAKLVVIEGNAQESEEFSPFLGRLGSMAHG